MRLDQVGMRVRLTKPLTTRCCSAIVPVGEVITVFGAASAQPGLKHRKRVRIDTSTGAHTVSTGKVAGEVVE